MVPGFTGGGPMMPPSTKVAPPFSTMPPISRAVAGEIALPSTKVPAKRSPATSFATSTAAWGGQTDRITSLARTSAVTETHVLEFPVARALARLGAPALAGPQHARSARAHGGAHLAAHITRIQKPDRGHALYPP